MDFRVLLQVNGTLFFDKRDASQFDYLTVNETAFDPPTGGEDPENNINSPERLSLEATMINQNFSQQILKAGNRKVLVGVCVYHFTDDSVHGHVFGYGSEWLNMEVHAQESLEPSDGRGPSTDQSLVAYL